MIRKMAQARSGFRRAEGDRSGAINRGLPVTMVSTSCRLYTWVIPLWQLDFLPDPSRI
jgi:hypothetical protein